MATCPECDAELDVDEFDVDKGDVISCPECGSNLEVSGVSPLEVEVLGEDDDDDEDFDGDEEEGEEEDEEEEQENWDE
jgi:alpha-aminoadipate/glutamate carrier protein LysW